MSIEKQRQYHENLPILDISVPLALAANNKVMIDGAETHKKDEWRTYGGLFVHYRHGRDHLENYIEISRKFMKAKEGDERYAILKDMMEELSHCTTRLLMEQQLWLEYQKEIEERTSDESK